MLPWSPVPVVEAQVVMHEMTHLLLWAQGFPLIVGNPKIGELIARINTAFHDPLVETYLRKYDVNPWLDFKSVQDRTLESLPVEDPCAPEDKSILVQLLRGLYYATAVLDYRTAAPFAPDDENIGNRNLAEAFAQLSPGMKEDGEKLLSIVDDIGFENPDKMGKLLQEILVRYDLTAVCQVKYPGKGKKK